MASSSSSSSIVSCSSSLNRHVSSSSFSESCSPYSSNSKSLLEQVKKIMKEGIQSQSQSQEKSKEKETVSENLLEQFEHKNSIVDSKTKTKLSPEQVLKGNGVFINQIISVIRDHYPRDFQSERSIVLSKTTNTFKKEKDPNVIVPETFPLHKISPKDLFFQKQIKHKDGTVETIQNPFRLDLRSRKHRDFTLWKALRASHGSNETQNVKQALLKKRKEMTWEQKFEENEIEMEVKKYKTIQDDLSKWTLKERRLERNRFVGFGHTSACFQATKKRDDDDEEEEEEEEEEGETREFACKIIPSSYLNGTSEKQGTSRRIQIGKEVQILGQLNHPNIIKLQHVAKDELNVYLVTELCQNRDLSYFIDQKKIQSLSQCVSLLQQMLESLSYIHSNQIIHRDIKPSNIFIEKDLSKQKDGNVKLKLKFADFGFACQLHEDQTKTQIKGFIGTPNYASPEMMLSVESLRNITDKVRSRLEKQIEVSSSSSSSSSLEEYDFLQGSLSSSSSSSSFETVTVPLLEHIEGLSQEAKGEYSFVLDVWSIGVIFYRMLFHSFPFSGERNSVVFLDTKTTTKDPPQTQTQTIEKKDPKNHTSINAEFYSMATKIIQGVYQIPAETHWGEKVPKSFINLLKQMLTWNWNYRPTAKALLKNSLFSSSSSSSFSQKKGCRNAS